MQVLAKKNTACTKISLFRIKINLAFGFFKQNSVILGYYKFLSCTTAGFTYFTRNNDGIQNMSLI